MKLIASILACMWAASVAALTLVCPDGMTAIQACVPSTTTVYVTPSPSPMYSPAPKPLTPTSTFTPTPTLPPSSGLDAFAQTMLNKHNFYRARHHAPSLTWDSTVASAARSWISRCQFQHELNSKSGENLYMYTGTQTGQDAATTAADMWYNEVQYYDYNNPGFSSQTGHFCQIAWLSTTKIGCGMKVCPDGGTYISCKYSPPGNYLGAFKQNVLPP